MTPVIHPYSDSSPHLVSIASDVDDTLLKQWEAHLQPLQQAGLISFWSESHISAGVSREQAWKYHLGRADLIVLLLSSDFFASSDCCTLMKQALTGAHAGTTHMFPLLARPVVWQNSLFAGYPCLPDNGVAITTWQHPDEGWLSAVQGVRRRLSRVASHTMAPLGKRARTDRERMLHRLRWVYQASLDDSLQGVTWMELGLTEHPDAVRNATHLLQRLPDRTERMLPVGTRVLSAYEQAEEELLILGDPGAGKSMLLLDLAQQLIARAESDETHPLPVIVPLSSWAVSRAKIAQWLVEQLARIYDVPRTLGQVWVEQGQVLPLLDGLDEMEEGARPLCIAAINAYHAEHLIPLVVCSRQAEYEVAANRERLVLQNAVIVQPLTKEQVANMIRQGGRELEGLHEAFVKNPIIGELATTPLMLSVLMLTYRGVPIGNLPQQQDRLEERIWTDYVERMVRTKGANLPSSTDIPEKRYSLAQTCASLSWLAQQMQVHNQTLFYGEYLQESWLPAAQQRAVRWLLVRLPSMLLGGLAGFLLELFVFATTDPILLCQIGLVGAFLGWSFSQEKPRGPVVVPRLERPRQRSLPHLYSAILLGFLCSAILLGFQYAANMNSDLALSIGPPALDLSIDGVNVWLRNGIITGITVGTSAWLFQSRLARMMLSSDHIPPRPTSNWSRRFGWMRTMPGRRAIWAGMLFGIGIWLSDSLISGLYFNNMLGESISALTSGLDRGLSVGGTALLVSLILSVQTGMIRLAERIHWSGRMFVQWHHLRTSLLIALACFCIFGLSLGLTYGLNYGLFYQGIGMGLSAGLIFGLNAGLDNGLNYGLFSGLIYWVLGGLYQGIRQEHLPDQDRRQFNQGLHRSLRNGALLSLLSAGIITGIALGRIVGLSVGLNTGLFGDSLALQVSAGLSQALSFGLSGGLNQALEFELNVGWLLVLCGWLVLWAATGGLTILRHYTLRLLLARSYTFPWHARRFLDDATARMLLRRVGGGYGFVHRRLLDYFANREADFLPTETGESTVKLTSSVDVLSSLSMTPLAPQEIADLPTSPLSTASHLLPCGHEHRPNARHCSVCGAPILS